MEDETILRQLRPIYLLARLYSTWDGVLRNHCGPIRGSYRRLSDDIVDAKCANCEREPGGMYPVWAWIPAIEGHPETERMRQRLLEHGVRSNFTDYSDPGMSARVFQVETSRATMRTVRRLAKLDAGLISVAEEAEFDQRFNLWFNQHYAFDWKEWQKYHPLIPQGDWPDAKYV